MLFNQSFFEIADNSGARVAKCIHVYNSSLKKGAFVGDVVLISVKRYIVKEKLDFKSGDKCKVVIIRTKRPVYRGEGIFINFDINSGVVLGSQKNPKGTRIFGPVFFELRRLGFSKIVSLAARTF